MAVRISPHDSQPSTDKAIHRFKNQRKNYCIFVLTFLSGKNKTETVIFTGRNIF